MPGAAQGIMDGILQRDPRAVTVACRDGAPADAFLEVLSIGAVNHQVKYHGSGLIGLLTQFSLAKNIPEVSLGHQTGTRVLYGGEMLATC